jgi:hypothetical protein
VRFEGIEGLEMPSGYVNAFFSGNGNYLAILSALPAGDAKSEFKMLNITVYSANLEKRYSVEKSHYFDEPFPVIAVSDRDGSIIVGENSSGLVRFYDDRGALLNEIELFPGAEYDLERILHIDLSAQGAAVMVAGKRGVSPAGSSAKNPSAEPHLFWFALSGLEIWRKALPGLNASAVTISGDGKYIAAGYYTINQNGLTDKKTLLLDSRGEWIGEFALLFKYADFSPASDALLLADNQTAYAVTLPGGEPMWEKTFPRQEGIIAAVQIVDRGNLSAILLAQNGFEEGKFMFTSPLIKIIDSSDEVIQTLEIKNQAFEKPALSLSLDGRQMVIGFQTAYQIYQIK